MRSLKLSDGTEIPVTEGEAIHHGAGSEVDRATRGYLWSKGWLGPTEADDGGYSVFEEVSGETGIRTWLLTEYMPPDWTAVLARPLDGGEQAYLKMVPRNERTGPGVEAVFKVLIEEGHGSQGLPGGVLPPDIRGSG